jgi:hypothetical protein
MSRSLRLFDIRLLVLAFIATAISAAFAGYQFTERRHTLNDATLVTDMALSGDPAKTMASIALSKEMVLSERVPLERYASIIAHAYASPDSKVQETADNSILEASRVSRPLSRDISKALAILPVRVIIRYAQNSSQEKANQIGESFRSQDIIVSQKPISVSVSPVSKTPDTTEVRCYGKEECSTTAPKFVDALKEMGILARIVDRSSMYEGFNLNRNRYEIWFPDAVLKQEATEQNSTLNSQPKRRRLTKSHGQT